jgi:hypothetical protein
MATTTSSARKPTRTDPTTTEIPPERILNYYYCSWRKGRGQRLRSFFLTLFTEVPRRDLLLSWSHS